MSPHWGGVSTIAAVKPEIIFDIAHPVGSIIQTTDSRNPSTYIEGGSASKWEQIQGKFILGVSGSHAVNSTGGSETVALTTAQLPAHTHTHSHTLNLTKGDLRGLDSKTNSYYIFMTAGGEEGRNFANIVSLSSVLSGSIANGGSSVGSNQAHQNMPPFISLYIWKRTA